MDFPDLDDDVQCIEVEVKSVDESKSSSKKSTKRRVYDVPQNTPKKIRSGDSSDEGSKNRPRKTKPASKPKQNDGVIDPDELKGVLEGMDDDIDNVLEETAEKNRLTATNVKNILRHIVTNEYVLSMVRNTMKDKTEDGELEEAFFEPKLTRSKVKELQEKHQMTLPLHWTMSTPVKQVEPETKALLEEEFPDESSSDEDYKPNEEECPSEEENVMNSPKSTDLDSSICEKPPTPVTKPDEEMDDDIGLVIALPETETEPVSESVAIDNEIDKISLRTRSKLPLNDTPLEAIEANFIAPDITEDMYDTVVDNEEWQKFLLGLYNPSDVVTAVEKPEEEPDDPEEDPEYNALEDEDVPEELELRYDNSVKIPMKELMALMAETHEFDQLLFYDTEGEEEETEVSLSRLENNKSRKEASKRMNQNDKKNKKCKKNKREGTSEREAIPVSETPVSPAETTRVEYMTEEEKLQLAEQMRMYIQLITQSYLLSFGIPELNFINLTSKILLEEIKYFASAYPVVNRRSAFHAHNLDGALDIVEEYENNRNKFTARSKIRSKGTGRPGIANIYAKKTMFSSKVFIYPELLPRYGFFKDAEIKKALFCPAEDNLVAIGLEEFSFAANPLNYIQMFLVPCKTEEQIKIRIKNCKFKGSIENPIKYYFTYKRAPSFPRSVKPFDPDNVKAPKDFPPEVLPGWMRLMLPIIPSTILPKEPKPPITVKPIRNYPPKRRLRSILPRNVHSSPLKQISPILRKYSQKRLIPSSSLGNSVNITGKTVHFKRVYMKSPKHMSNTEIIKKEGTENNNRPVTISGVKEEIENANPNSTMLNEVDSKTCLENAGISKVSECVPDEGISESEGHVELDECDEEIIDDEPESSTQHDPILSNNVINKKHSVNKKKNKQQRDLESSLALLQPHLLERDPKREEREHLFANSYLLRVTEALKEDTDACETFFKILCKHQHSAQSPVKLYAELKEILKDYPALADDFVAFLSPEQAKECGKYKEFLLLNKIRSFLRKVEVHFQNQPQHLLKILRTLAQFKQQSSITSSEVLSILQPLLKNQSHLTEELINLLPDLAPSETLMTDFEEVNLPNSDDDNSSVSCEEITIPEVPDLYGGKDCPCECHTSSTETKVLNKTRHCVKCGVKFMDGRVYIQTGKVLKPAQVIYQDALPEPVPISNGEGKTAAKNKQPNSSSSIKNSVASDQTSKPEVSPVKKDGMKIPTPTSAAIQPPVVPPEEPVPSTSRLPCDVIEDTVFPSVPVESKKSVPPDFSRLKEVIRPTNDKGGSPTEKSGLSDNPAEVSNTGEQLNQSSKIADNQIKWTREEDKLIIYNCQRFGVTEKAFETSGAALKSRSLEEIQERFMHLMKVFAKEFNIQ